jgi:5-formyltetrahydrofolate cyclo-ligase
MKEEIRSLVLKKRTSMPFSEKQKKSTQIKERLFQTDEFQNAETVLFYVSYDHEVGTHEMIKESLTMKKRVAVPKTDMTSRTIICSSLVQWEDLLAGAYKILEPRKGCVNEVSPDSIDLMIIPGIAFDYQGNRIGHGMGYFDRLLQRKNHACHIGLAFEIQIVENIPSQKHDKKVEKIVTEDRIIVCD